MEKIINKQKLEELLTAHWADILDVRKLIAYIMLNVRDEKLKTFVEDILPDKGVEITITKFAIQDEGFFLWIDFTIPKENGFAIGTCETHLSNSGVLTTTEIVGQLLKRR